MGAQVFNLTSNKMPAYTNNLAVNRDRHGILFTIFANAYLAKCRKNKHAKECYYQTLTHFTKFCLLNDLTPQTYEIGMEMLEDYVFYLQSVAKLMNSTVSGHLVHFKTLIKMASYSGYDVDYTYSDVVVKEYERDVVSLDTSEITRIYYYKELSSSEERIRDLFILGCMTGLRYSDYSRLTEDNFVDNKIQIKTKKTGVLVIIPQAKYVRELLRKYNYQCPVCVGIQYFNKVIKRICRKVGICQPTPYERIIGTEKISVVKEKWELICSHTARRSAATNMFLAGIPPLRIMMITGHKTEAAFMRYIGLTKEENAATLAGSMFFH